MRWPCYRRRFSNPPTWETGAEVLAHFSKEMRECTFLLEVNAYFLVIFVQLKNEELLEHVQIHDTGNNRSLLRAQNTFTFGLSRTCSRETRGFSLPQILTTAIKFAFITENDGVQKSLIVLYPMKHLRTEFVTSLPYLHP
jgi:hypothetical protein